MKLMNKRQVDYIKKMIGNYDAVFLDLDDTLINTGNVNFILYKKIFNKFNISINKNVWESVFNGRKLEDSLLDHLVRIKAEELFSEIIIFFYKFADKIKLESLDKNQSVKILKTGIIILNISKKMNKKVFLCTTSRRIFADFLLDKFKIRKYFDHIICAEDIKNGKPNPEIYKKAMSILGRKKKSIVIEDSIYGMLAAKNAKCDCLIVSNNMFKFYEAQR